MSYTLKENKKVGAGFVEKKGTRDDGGGGGRGIGGLKLLKFMIGKCEAVNTNLEKHLLQ